MRKLVIRGCGAVIGVFVVITIIGSIFSGGQPNTKTANLAAPAPTQVATEANTPEPTKVVTATIESDSPVEALPTAQTGTVVETVVPVEMVATANTTANIRYEPRTEASSIVGKLGQGEQVKILMRNADSTWLGVETSSGLRGWVSAELMIADAAVAGQIPEGTTEQLGIVLPTAAPADAPAAAPPAEEPGQAPPAAADVGAWPCQAGQVKGNNKSGIYHSPGQRDYGKTQANVTCFDTGAQAEAAGFRAAKR